MKRPLVGVALVFAGVPHPRVTGNGIAQRLAGHVRCRCQADKLLQRWRDADDLTERLSSFAVFAAATVPGEQRNVRQFLIP